MEEMPLSANSWGLGRSNIVRTKSKFKWKIHLWDFFYCRRSGIPGEVRTIHGGDVRKDPSCQLFQ